MKNVTRGTSRSLEARIRRLERRAIHSNVGARRFDSEMRSWTVAASRADTTPANIVFLGDSTFGGGSATERRYSFQRRIAAEFGKLYNFTPGPGYISLAVPNVDWTPQLEVASGTCPEDNRSGLGLGSGLLSVGGRLNAYTEGTDLVTGMDLFYPKYPGSDGNIDVYLGIFPVGSLSTSAATAIGGRRASYPFNEGVAPALSAFNLRQSGSEAVGIEGVMLYNGDRDRGVRVWDAAHNGFGTSNYHDVTAAGCHWADAFDSIEPDLLVYTCGALETLAEVAPADYESRLVEVIRGARERAPLGDDLAVVLVAPYGITEANRNLAYRDITYRIAAQENCAVFDYYNVFGEVGTGDPYSLTVDGIHLDDTAQAAQAGAMFNFLKSFCPALHVDLGNTATVDVVSNVATSTLLGRTTAGTGDSEELSASSARTLLNVANGATANDTDANLKNRANHTGTDAAGSIPLTSIGAGTHVAATTGGRLLLTDFGGPSLAFYKNSGDAQAAVVVGAGLDISTGPGGSTAPTLLAEQFYPKYRTINAKTGNYTLVLTDVGKNVTASSGSTITITIPTNASVAFPVGTEIVVTRLGAGTVTIAGPSVTLRSRSGLLSVNGQYGVVTLRKLATDEWSISGDLV